MRNKALALATDSIPYIKDLRKIAGSVTAAILMQQLDFRFNQKPDGFYKFVAPCKNVAYRDGDSWIEELGFSEDEFVTAFSKIGLRHNSKTAYDLAEDAFIDADGKEYFYASYHDRIQGLTFYFRNHEVMDAALDKLFTRESLPSNPTSSPRKPTIPVYVNGQSRFTQTGNPALRKPAIPVSMYKESETTTEKTTEREKPLPEFAAPEDNLFAAIKDVTGFIPADERDSSRVWTVAEKLRGAGVKPADVRNYAATRTTSLPKLRYLYEDVTQWLKSQQNGNGGNLVKFPKPDVPAGLSPGQVKRWMEDWNRNVRPLTSSTV